MTRTPPRRLPLWVALAVASGSLSAAPALEEVIVTAEKREESIQQVPISIAAFTDETLEKMGVNDVKALAGKVPNV
ncbi:MAG TPA: TonB-dependent receptor, partial [Halioglobus sp.]